LPAAKAMTAAQVLGTRYRLADAQFAIARKTGFASWPNLARHVEQLRALEGTWAFERLEIDGGLVPAGALSASRILFDGDRFRTESPEAIYEGVFNINVESQPHEIDIEFVAGPESGNCNFGIYRLDGDQLQLCLDMKGKPRPEEVMGGTQPVIPPSPPAHDCLGFDFVEGPALARLQGTWRAVKIIRDGQDFAAQMLETVVRTATKNEIRISFGSQTMMHALVRLDEKTDPMRVDYYNIGGACPGTIQHGLLKWVGDEACFCMAAPGHPRPADFACPAGSQRTVSQWRITK
jgi:uncharacterized protein (TIGR03067 family)